MWASSSGSTVRPACFRCLSDRFVEKGSIPATEDGGEQVEPSHVAVSAVARAETQPASFSLAYDPAPYRNRPLCGH